MKLISLRLNQWIRKFMRRQLDEINRELGELREKAEAEKPGDT